MEPHRLKWGSWLGLHRARGIRRIIFQSLPGSCRSNPPATASWLPAPGGRTRQTATVQVSFFLSKTQKPNIMLVFSQALLKINPLSDLIIPQRTLCEWLGNSLFIYYLIDYNYFKHI